MSNSGIRSFFGVETQSNALSDAAQQVSEQLSIVSKLRLQNSEFLNQLEKDWIDNLVTRAALVIERSTTSNETVTERQSPRRSRLKNPVFLQQIKTIIQQSPMSTTELTQLLITAQSLNSAISLLSCCYDRYHWSQTGSVSVDADVDWDGAGSERSERSGNTHTNSSASQRELSQFLHRRKQIPQERVARVVRLASICMHGQRPASLDSKRDSERGIQRTPSLFDKDTRQTSEPEGLLSVMIVESIDQWRDNAELALRMTTQRLPTKIANDVVDGSDDSVKSTVDNVVQEINASPAPAIQPLPNTQEIASVPVTNGSLVESKTPVAVEQSLSKPPAEEAKRVFENSVSIEESISNTATHGDISKPETNVPVEQNFSTSLVNNTVSGPDDRVTSEQSASKPPVIGLKPQFSVLRKPLKSAQSMFAQITSTQPTSPPAAQLPLASTSPLQHHPMIPIQSTYPPLPSARLMSVQPPPAQSAPAPPISEHSIALPFIAAPSTNLHSTLAHPTVTRTLSAQPPYLTTQYEGDTNSLATRSLSQPSSPNPTGSILSTTSQQSSIVAISPTSNPDLMAGPPSTSSRHNSMAQSNHSLNPNMQPYYELPGSEVRPFQMRSIPQIQFQPQTQSHWHSRSFSNPQLQLYPDLRLHLQPQQQQQQQQQQQSQTEIISNPSISSVSLRSTISDDGTEIDEVSSVGRHSSSQTPDLAMLSPSSTASSTNSRGRISSGRAWLERQARMNG